MTIQEWLTAYHALDEQQEVVTAAKEAAGEGNGSYADADSAGFDLWERYTDLAHAAAEMLRELVANSTLPTGKQWRHLDDSLCDSVGRALVKNADAEVVMGICDEHDRRVFFKAHEPKEGSRTFNYEQTHASALDGSTAMLIRELGDLVVLVNEDGDAWSDPADQWRPIDTE